MPRDRDEPAAVPVYTVCDESKYLVVRNVPALGCEDELGTLFSTYGPLEECKPMDAEDCEEYTDVFFIKFSQVSNARFAERKLDESVFLGNRLQVSYTPQFESIEDTKEKLEVRRKHQLDADMKGYLSIHWDMDRLVGTHTIKRAPIRELQYLPKSLKQFNLTVFQEKDTVRQ